MDNLAIEVNALSVSYHTKINSFHALGPVSFNIQPGEFVSILGPSGCGKSTLAKVLTGIIRNYEGTFKLSNSIKTISNVFQDYGVFPWKTALENVAFPLREKGHNKREAQDLAQSWLEKLRIGNFAQSYPYQLSGGMKQRLSIARALSTQPDFLILDEPFAAIDTQLREVLQEELLELQQANSMTTLQFTHNYDEAILLSDRILIMSPSPATLKEEILIEFQRPRTAELREQVAFSEIRSMLRETLRIGVK
ncbi:MAG: ABC transporter ATP-binding protein [Candidatus Nanopelagicales bacterium]